MYLRLTNKLGWALKKSQFIILTHIVLNTFIYLWYCHWFCQGASVTMEKAAVQSATKTFTANNARKVVVVGGWKGFGSTEAVMQLTVGTLMFTVASLFLTKYLCSHLTHVLNSKISPGVQQAVGADLVRQVQRECINFFHRGEKCFLRFQYAPLCLYPCISVFLRSHLTPEEIFERFSLVLKDRCKKN